MRTFVAAAALLLLVPAIHAQENTYFRMGDLSVEGANGPPPPGGGVNNPDGSKTISANAGPGWRILDSVDIPVLVTGADGTLSVSVSNMPGTIAYNSATQPFVDDIAGHITGQFLVPGPVTLGLSATDSAGTATGSVNVTVHPLVEATHAGPVAVQVGTPVSIVASATGIVQTASWVASVETADLPIGLSVSPAGNAISGTPTSPGSVSGIAFTATDSWDGLSDTSPATSLTVFEPAALAVAPSTNVRASGPISIPVSSSGGYDAGPVQVTGTFPPGTSFNGTAIVGTPAAVASSTTYTLTATVGNSWSSASSPITITVLPEMTAPALSPQSYGTNGMSYTPPAPTGIVGTPTWSFSPLSGSHTGLSVNSSDGTITSTRNGYWSQSDLILRVTDSADGSYIDVGPISLSVEQKTAANSTPYSVGSQNAVSWLGGGAITQPSNKPLVIAALHDGNTTVAAVTQMGPPSYPSNSNYDQLTYEFAEPIVADTCSVTITSAVNLPATMQLRFMMNNVWFPTKSVASGGGKTFTYTGICGPTPATYTNLERSQVSFINATANFSFTEYKIGYQGVYAQP